MLSIHCQQFWQLQELQARLLVWNADLAINTSSLGATLRGMRLPTTNQINCQALPLNTPLLFILFYFLTSFYHIQSTPRISIAPFRPISVKRSVSHPPFPVLPFAWNTSPFYSPGFLVQPNIFVSCFQIKSLRSTQTFLLILTLMLTTFNLPKNNKIRNIKKKKSQQTRNKFQIQKPSQKNPARWHLELLCVPAAIWADRATCGAERAGVPHQVEAWEGRVSPEDTGKQCESLMLCSTAKANAIQTLGLAITTELLNYLLQVKLLVFHVKNNREKPTHYETQPLLPGIYSPETSQEKFGEQPWMKTIAVISQMWGHTRDMLPFL